MTKEKNETLQKQSRKISDRQYDPQDYQRNDDLSKGFAVTHEQVSDTYTEGTIDGVMEDVAGKDIKLEQKEYKFERK